MPLNYDEAIAELRLEETRLSDELDQVRAAIPALIILRNRSRATETSETKTPSLPGMGKFVGLGATAAILQVLKQSSAPILTEEVYDALRAQGWTSQSERPIGIVSATLGRLTKENVAERIGDRWRMRTISEARSSLAIEPPQPSLQ